MWWKETYVFLKAYHLQWMGKRKKDLKRRKISKDYILIAFKWDFRKFICFFAQLGSKSSSLSFSRWLLWRMEVKCNSDTYKIISRENNKADVAWKVSGTGHG